MDKLPDTITFIDVETTGMNPLRDRIIDIGILRVEHGEVVETFESLVNPEIYLPPEIEIITGIHRQDLTEAPVFSDIKDRVLELTEGALFAAHNARFDYAFLRNELARLELTFQSKLLCTARLSRRLFPGERHHNLDAVIARHGIPCSARHRAFPDAEVLALFYAQLLRDLGEETMLGALKTVMKAPTLPPDLPPEALERLPEAPGVYIFRDKTDTILYVGKSVNIRSRVLSHFSSDYQSAGDMKMAQTVASIDVLETAGELGALLTEAHLIKEMQPVYNRMLRRSRDMLAVLRIERPDGYYGIETKEAHLLEPREIERVLAVYKSRKDMKTAFYEIAEAYELCPKLLGLENGRGACFASQLGRCRGACCGDELAVSYNVRFVQAFSKTRVGSWPFPGAIAIEEGTNDVREYHVVNNWCYVTSLKADGEGQPGVGGNDLRFDWDTYKILKKFILGKRSDMHIRLIP